MRAREIILELREYMDRTKYGCWIDALSKKIYYVPTAGHGEIIIKIAANRSEEGTGGKEIYEWGFENHFVRVEYGDTIEINIDGYSEDIKRISHILLASCAQPEIEEVVVDVPDKHESRSFMVPGQRRELMMFIKGETG